MTTTELEHLVVDLPLTEFSSRLIGMSEEDLCQVRNHPLIAYFLVRLWKLRLGDELTVEKVEADVAMCRAYPASLEYYKAQAELHQQRRSRHSRV